MHLRPSLVRCSDDVALGHPPPENGPTRQDVADAPPGYSAKSRVCGGQMGAQLGIQDGETARRALMSS